MDQAKEFHRKGIELKDKGNYSEAVKCFTSAVAFDEGYKSAWYQKGCCEDELKEYEKSIQSYDRAIQLDLKFIYPWNNKGSTFYNLGQYQKALDCYNHVIQLDSNFKEAWFNKGSTLEYLGRYQEALDCYDNAIQLDPNSKEAWNNKGSTLDYLGRQQEALDCYDQALQLDSMYTSVWNNKGSILKTLKRYQDALDWFSSELFIYKFFNFYSYDKAIAIQPKAFYYDNKGDALKLLKRYTDALESYQQALKLDPNYQYAQNSIKEIQNQVFEEAKIQEINNERMLVQKLSEIQQDNVNDHSFKFSQIKKQFIAKLLEDNAYEWLTKFSGLKTQQNCELCSYFQHILPLMLTEAEAKDIQIYEFMAQGGGFARIHLGLFRDQLVAIKEQMPAKNESDSIFLALLREIAIFAVCGHPNIAKILAVYFNPQPSQFSVWTLHPQYYLDLYVVLFGGNQFLIPKKKDICCQILEGINYLHSLGIIHMDLKPKNIIFETEDFKKILLLDFGISKIKKQNEDPTNMIGMSYHYSPPEVKETDASQVSPKSDIFSAGIIIYELVTGRKAFPNQLSQGNNAIYQLIRNAKFDFFKENQLTGNQELDKFIGNCVQYDPSRRLTAAAALAKMKMIKF